MLRAGGYFVWAAQPVYKHEETQQEAWMGNSFSKGGSFGNNTYISGSLVNLLILASLKPEMEELTGRMCWKLIKKSGYIAIWQKPFNNSCYLSRDPDTQPPLCNEDDNLDDVWYHLIRILSFGYSSNDTNYVIFKGM